MIMIGSEDFQNAQGPVSVIANEIPLGSGNMADHSATQSPDLLDFPRRDTGHSTSAIKTDLPDRRVQVPVQISAATGINLNERGGKRIRIAERISLDYPDIPPMFRLRRLIKKVMTEDVL